VGGGEDAGDSDDVAMPVGVAARDWGVTVAVAKARASAMT
jgi:hypothetical protein